MALSSLSLLLMGRFKPKLHHGLDRFIGSRFLRFTRIRLGGLLAAPILLQPHPVSGGAVFEKKCDEPPGGQAPMTSGRERRRPVRPEFHECWAGCGGRK
jgi:hypothetical protein